MEARRQSPDNAYFILLEAAMLAPQSPGDLALRLDQNPDEQVHYRAEPGTVGHFLGMQRPDDDEEMLAYLDECEVAIAKAREALDKPYFLEPRPDGTSEDALALPESNFRINQGLPRLFIARALQRSLTQDTDAEAFAYLFDCMRLGNMITAGDRGLHAATPIGFQSHMPSTRSRSSPRESPRRTSCRPCRKN